METSIEKKAINLKSHRFTSKVLSIIAIKKMKLVFFQAALLAVASKASETSEAE